MKRALSNFLKCSKWIYFCYFYIGSFCMKLLKLFIVPDDNLILFSCFGGKKYDDSPKAIYELMVSDNRFKNYRFVWAFHSPEKFDIKGAELIKTDNLRYFITALKARVWITNSSIERGLYFKGKRTLYFNTWHGTPIKKMGNDIAANNKAFVIKKKMKIDAMTVQSDFEAEVFSKMFNIPMRYMLKIGLPRNDILANFKNEKKEHIKKKLGISFDKKIILYAPTFREFERDSANNCILKPPMDISKWKRTLYDEYCVLFRTHYEVAKSMKFKNDGFIYDMSLYPNLNELMLVSDILISDYSSIFFDFSIMDKTMFHFTYDYDKYSNERGMYFDIREYLSGSENEDELLSILRHYDEMTEKAKNKIFRQKYVNYYGNASFKAVEYIANNIGL